MERRVLWMAMLLVASLSVGCGGDDSGGDDDDEGGRSGGGDQGGNGAVGGGRIEEGEGVVCGTTHCTMPEGSTAEPCCMDAFSNSCGMMSGGFGGGAMTCVAIVPVDTRCPSVNAGPITLASCCTEANQCGITSMFMPGTCTDLATAEQMFMERFSGGGDEDGGMGGPPGGFMLTFPDPQPCE